MVAIYAENCDYHIGRTIAWFMMQCCFSSYKVTTGGYSFSDTKAAFQVRMVKSAWLKFFCPVLAVVRVFRIMTQYDTMIYYIRVNFYNVFS
jgi:hypothetical protein